MNEKDEKFIKEKYMEMQAIDAQMKEVEKHDERLDDQINEVLVTKKALMDFKEVKVDTETLMPLANGIFAKAVVKDTQKLIVNVGNNVATEKTVDETIYLMDEQLDELDKYKAKMNENMQALTLKVKEIEKVVDLRVKKNV